MTSLPRQIVLFLPLLSAAVLMVGCARSPVVEEVPPPVEVAVPEVPEPPRATRRERSAEEDFWMSILQTANYDAENGLALVAYGLEISTREYQAGLEKWRALNPNRPDLEYRSELRYQMGILRWLRNAGEANDPEFRAEARQRLRAALTELAVERRLRGIVVTEAAIEARYQERIAEFRTPEQVHVQMIQVPTEEEAQQVLERLEEGEEFAALANALSRHESRRQSGELDPFPRGTYNPSFEDVAFALNPGEVNIAITAAGAIVIRKIANVPASQTPLAEVRETLRRQLQEEQRAALLEEFRNEVETENVRPMGGQ